MANRHILIAAAFTMLGYFAKDVTYTVYGGDIFYITGCHLSTEMGIDTTFQSKKDLAIFLEDYSAKEYHESLKWELERVVRNARFYKEDGQLRVEYDYPYTNADSTMWVSEVDIFNNN